MKTIAVDDGKYKFIRDDRGLMVDILRHGEHWEDGFERMQFDKPTHALLDRIEELEHAVQELKERA